MPTGYPGALDSLTNPTAGNNLSDAAVLHDQQHANANDAIEAIQAILGTNPNGVSLTVKDRLIAVESSVGAKANASLIGTAGGLATLDGSSKLVQNLDATKLTSGLLDVNRLPNHSAALLTSGTLALAQLPASIPAAQIGSGVFALARIPGLPGSQITSGTISAAFLPTSVTANANVRVEADISARDAIPLIDRVNGMLVWTTTETAMWKWRSAGSAWDLVGGNVLQPQEMFEGTDILGAANTTFAGGTPYCGVAFKAPPSGKILQIIGGHFEQNTSGNQAYLAGEIRNGAVLSIAGTGTVVQTAVTDDGPGIGFVTGTSSRVSSSMPKLVTGLTPGADYNIRVLHVTTPAGSVDVFSRRVTVIPVVGV